MSTQNKPLHAPILGELTFDKATEWWEGSIYWNETVITIQLSATDTNDLQKATKIGNTICENIENFDRLAKEIAAEKLLDLRNNNWLEEDQDEDSPEDFKLKMSLKSIFIDSKGCFSFDFDDGDLFWGHSIVAEGSISDGFTDASIG